MAENSELSERQKVKAISKAANRYRSEGKASKVYVTTKKTKAGSVGTTAGGKGKVRENHPIPVILCVLTMLFVTPMM
jgi:hypothetical protein